MEHNMNEKILIKMFNGWLDGDENILISKKNIK